MPTICQKSKENKLTDILLDTSNLYHRIRHTIRSDDPEEKVAMALHTIFKCINKVWRDFHGSHVVACFEGTSWRKEVEPSYKANRAARRAAMTPAQVQEDKIFFEGFENFTEWAKEKTNFTTLQHPRCEADDFIARWIQNHPERQHVIVSSDTDYYQLLANNVIQYNGISKQIISLEGFMDEDLNPVLDNKTKQPLSPPDPQWLLFEKCMRGDSSDNVFSAYPGVRTKSTKKRVGLMEAYADMQTKSYDWNNLMLQEFDHHDGNRYLVKDRYEANRTLIDLTRQPDDIKLALDQTIEEAIAKPPRKMVGVEFLKFCGKWNLNELSKHPDKHAAYLNARYSNA
jgi:5'-3' exonuclease